MAIVSGKLRPGHVLEREVEASSQWKVSRNTYREALRMDFRDIASVQILRGPQGTLFGRNTIGGAVLLTTNGPGDGAGNSVRLGVGEDNLRELFGAFDIPLGDQFAARIAVGGRERDGYVTRVFDGEDLGNEKMYTGQIGIRWKPSDAFSLTLRGDYTNEDENGSPFVFQSMNEAATFVGAASQAAGCPNMVEMMMGRSL